MRHRSYYHHLFRDFLIVSASILVSILLARGGVIQDFIEVANGSSAIISSIIAGAFFTSIFTIAPSIVGLVAIGETTSPLIVAFWGAFGAMFVDLVISSFVRKDISKDLDGLAKITLRKHIIKAFHFGFLKWFAFVVGLLFISTPLPDEFGLFMIGISKVQTWVLPLVFYISHFIGIYLVLTIAANI